MTKKNLLTFEDHLSPAKLELGLSLATEREKEEKEVGLLEEKRKRLCKAEKKKKETRKKLMEEGKLPKESKKESWRNLKRKLWRKRRES